MNTKNHGKRVYLAGVPFDPCTGDEALALAADALKNTRTTPPLTVVTPNAVIAGKCLGDPELCRLLDRASLCLPDGAGTVLASKVAATRDPGQSDTSSAVSPFPERVAGIDFGYGVLKIAAAEGSPVYLLGGRPGIAKQATIRLTESLPRLSFAGTHDGYFDPENGQEVSRLLDGIRASHTKILFVCLGFPKQERFLLRYTDTLPEVRIAAGLGGSLDVWAGKYRRAPEWIRRAKLEWLYRVCLEPRRIPDLKYVVRFLSGCRKSGENLHSFPKNTSLK